MSRFKKAVRILYGLFILLYIPFVIYLLFFAFFREQPSQDEMRIIPFYSTYQYLTQTVPRQNAVFFVLGNIYLLFPFGCIGVLFPKLNHLGILLPVAFVLITIMETMQQLTRRGVFDIDDILLNTLGVGLGYYTYNIFYRKFLN